MHYPIIGWGCLPEDLTQRNVFERIRECGVNVFMTCASSSKAIHAQLDLAAKVGIGALVADPRLNPSKDPQWRAQTVSAISEYAGHEALFAYYVRDEPMLEDFPHVAEMVALIAEHDADHPCWVNAFGFGCRGADSFPHYLEQYVRVIRPPFISFDNYPISRVPPKATWSQFYETDCGIEFPQLDAYYRNCYWEAWETCRQVGWKYDLPLWGFILATPGQHSVWFLGPVNEGTIRLEAFTALAYGARAVQYFLLPTLPGGYWGEGILDVDGQPSMQYDAIRRVNRDIASLGSVTKRLDCGGVYHTGKLTSGCHRFSTVRGGIDSSHRPLSRVEGDPLIISFLNDPDGQRFLLLVNRHPARAARIQATLDDGWQAREVQRRMVSSSSPEKPETAMPPNQGPLVGPVFLVSLEPGDGRLFQLVSGAQ